MTSPGSMLALEMRFSQIGTTAVTLTAAPFAASARTAAAAAAPPAISPLIPAMDEAAFRQYPPESTVTPFPTSPSLRRLPGAPV